MKPLQKITLRNNIVQQLISRGFSWDDAFLYLKDYNPSTEHHQEWNDMRLYLAAQVAQISEDVLIAIASELGAELPDGYDSTNEVVNADFWRLGYYKLFISHLTDNKISATYLKKNLIKYGIDCFIAHEDIEPSKLWLTEIEKALSTMNCLCAIITPDFYKSKWCDQEIGIAIGRSTPVLSIKKGADPHGFISKYQAIPARDTADLVAADVFHTLCIMSSANKEYFNVIGRLFLNAKSTDEALQWIELINSIENTILENVVKEINSKYRDNNILNNKKIIIESNKLFAKFKLPILSQQSTTSSNEEVDDLPF